MSRIATFPQSARSVSARTVSVRAAVLDLLAQAAPQPEALGGHSPEEQEFLETLRRIVARCAAEDLWCRYHSSRRDD